MYTKKAISSVPGEGGTKKSAYPCPCLPNPISCKELVPSSTFTQVMRTCCFGHRMPVRHRCPWTVLSKERCSRDQCRQALTDEIPPEILFFIPPFPPAQLSHCALVERAAGGAWWGLAYPLQALA